MNKYYTKERNVQILIQLLKDNGIRKVIASPGTINIAFVGSVQNDEWFEVYSCVDERSAAYMACGMAEESGEPVVITCTGATASRNYFSALTEAYYRKIPIVAVTATPTLSWTGNNMAQFIDRSKQPADTVINSYTLNQIKDADDEWNCTILINKGLVDLKRNGGGPVHFNLVSMDAYDFSTKSISPVRSIKRYTRNDVFPALPKGRIGIFIASHHIFSAEETSLIEQFCYNNNSVVMCDHTSGYYGRYKIIPAIYSCQNIRTEESFRFELIIHIGEVSGDYYTGRILQESKEIWRVSEDGLIKDTFFKLTTLFDMNIRDFFTLILSRESNSTKQYDENLRIINQLRSSIPQDLPFSNIWVAQQLSSKIPMGSALHLGILNTLRSWNFFEIPQNVSSHCNVGGFGIDGPVSSLIGASLANKDKLFYGIVGDLAFFYDMNSLGNRHVGTNIRLLVINNGKGVEFRNLTHPASQWGDDADLYFAAGGHFGNKSQDLVRNYAENLGFKYLRACNKEEFLSAYNDYLSDNNENGRSIIFEVFVNSVDDVKALSIVNSIATDDSVKGHIKKVANSVLPDGVINAIKKKVL